MGEATTGSIEDMLRTHRVKLNPTEAQASYLAQCAGVARYAWNWALNRWREIKTNGQKASFNEIKKEFRKSHETVFDLETGKSEPHWRKTVASCVIDYAFSDLARSISTYYKAKQTYMKRGDKKTAARLKFPSWRKRRDGQGGFGYANTRFSVERHWLSLDRGGVINMAEQLRFTGKLMSCRIVQEAGEWFAAISVETNPPPPSTGEGVVGVHFGLRHFATIATGLQTDATQVEIRRAYKDAEPMLAKAQRHLSRKTRGSNRYRKQKAKVARLHKHIADQREFDQHNLTTGLIRMNAKIAYDKWDIQGLIDLPDQRWAKGFYDAAIGKVIKQLEYKGQMYGVTVKGVLIKASKMCSTIGCDFVNASLTLADKKWSCPQCGEEHDREINAAMNNYLQAVELAAGTNQVGVTDAESEASDSDSGQD